MESSSSLVAGNNRLFKMQVYDTGIRDRRHVFNEAASTKPDFLPFLRVIVRVFEGVMDLFRVNFYGEGDRWIRPSLNTF